MPKMYHSFKEKNGCNPCFVTRKQQAVYSSNFNGKESASNRSNRFSTDAQMPNKLFYRTKMCFWR